MKKKIYKENRQITFMDKVLFFLLKKNAHKKAVKISTTDLARVCGMSQQNASRRIIYLEKEGIIQRIVDGIKVTSEGEEIGRKEYLELKTIFEGGKIRIRGKIVEGGREGGYYLKLEHYKKEIKNNFGFLPYPGTLNIKIRKEDVEKRGVILKKELITIPGFNDKKRSYGELFAYPGKLNGNKVVIIFPLRTYHGKDIIEVVAGKDIKELKKKKEIVLEID